VEGTAQDVATLKAIIAVAGQAPTSLRAELHADGTPMAVVDHHEATRAQSVLAGLATDAIELLTGPDRSKLRACHAPGCTLYYLKDHPRREWCSNTCGNRARQARHYQRTRRPGQTASGGSYGRRSGSWTTRNRRSIWADVTH
jgi:predicted RNA-binding Zn ribbon-like protein